MSSIRSAHTGSLLVMAAAVLWGTTGTAQALSPYDGSPPGLGAARIAVAGVVLAAVAVAAHGRAAFAGLRRPGAPALLAVGAAAMATYQVCFFTATDRTGVAVGTLTAIGSAPLVAGLIGALTGHPPTRRWLAATAVAICGLALLMVPAGAAQVHPAGLAAGVAAGAGYALYTWCSRRLLDAGVPAMPLLAGLFLGGAVLVLPFGWRGTGGWLTDPGGLAVVGYLALVATVVPYIMWIRGMADTAPAVATTLTLTEPLTAATLGVAALGEPLTATLVAGALLLGTGLVMTVAAAPDAPQPVPEAPPTPAAGIPAGGTAPGRPSPGGTAPEGTAPARTRPAGGPSVGHGAEQRGDLAVGQPAGTAHPQVPEPDRPDSGPDQP